MKLSRLRGRKICERVQRQGRLWKGQTMFIRWLPDAPRHPAADRSVPAVYAGTIASTKLDKSAVRRNRMRRRCREALRLHLQNVQVAQSLQLLIAPRSSSLGAPFAEIQKDIRLFLTPFAHGTSSKAQ